jgi:metallo-beta-lactamase family protein
VLVVESTYGDRVHPAGGPRRKLADLLTAAQARRGTLLIPAFAVGRAQQIVYLLRQVMESGEGPEMAIHLDSPMACDATEVYRRHPEEPGLEQIVADRAGRSVFGRGVYIHSTREESMRLNGLDGPRVILSSSGMLTGGRVLHHLRRLLPEPRNFVVLAGFQAAGTRGRQLLNGAKTLRMHGQVVPVCATIAEILASPATPIPTSPCAGCRRAAPAAPLSCTASRRPRGRSPPPGISRFACTVPDHRQCFEL